MNELIKTTYDLPSVFASCPESVLREAAAKYGGFLPVTSKAGLKDAMSALSELRTLRVSVTKAGKAARDDATAFSRQVLARERELVAIVEPVEALIQGYRADYEAEEERKRHEAARAEMERARLERERVSALQSSLNHLSLAAARVAGGSSETISAELVSMEGFYFSVEWAEFQPQASSALEIVKKALGRMIDDAAARELMEAAIAASEPVREEVVMPVADSVLESDVVEAGTLPSPQNDFPAYMFNGVMADPELPDFGDFPVVAEKSEPDRYNLAILDAIGVVEKIMDGTPRSGKVLGQVLVALRGLLKDSGHEA